jgi:hypothetical protein
LGRRGCRCRHEWAIPTTTGCTLRRARIAVNRAPDNLPETKRREVIVEEQTIYRARYLTHADGNTVLLESCPDAINILEGNKIMLNAGNLIMLRS